MKRKELLKKLKKIAKDRNEELDFIREGGSHEIWRLGNKQVTIPRHNEISEGTAKDIIRKVR